MEFGVVSCGVRVDRLDVHGRSPNSGASVAQMRFICATCATVYFEFQLERGEKIFLFFSKAQLGRATLWGAGKMGAKVC